MDCRPLLIGQAPGPKTPPDWALYPYPATSAGGRLQQLTGLDRAEYLQRFQRVNVLSEFPGRAGPRDDKFPMREAKLAARAMRPLLVGRVVVLVGRATSEAFLFDREAPFHSWMEWQIRRPCPVSGCLGRAMVAIVPHPSGRNHWYNSAENRAEALLFWRDLLHQVLKTAA